jgi:hypothetical protein
MNDNSPDISELFDSATTVFAAMEEMREREPGFLQKLDKAGHNIESANGRLANELLAIRQNADQYEEFPPPEYKLKVIRMVENFAAAAATFTDLSEIVEPWSRSADISSGFRQIEAPTLAQLYSPD